jgi:hypothetical protein
MLLLKLSVKHYPFNSKFSIRLKALNSQSSIENSQSSHAGVQHE